MMKRRLIFSLVVLLAALVVTGSFAIQAARAQTATPAAPDTVTAASMRTITVSGTGLASGEPDVARVLLGVQTDATTAADALNQNNTQMEALLDSLTDAGIAEADIRTQSVQIYPRYDNSNPQPLTTSPEVIGFTASNVVEVRVDDLDRVGDILSGSVDAGGNTIQGIFFEISDQEALYDQAMEAALQDARRKADRLASLSGAQLGALYSVVEGSNIPIFATGRGGVVNQAAVDVPIQPGMQDVVVTLQVTWLIDSNGVVVPGTGGTAAPTVTTPAATSTRRATSTPIPTTPAATTTARATTSPAATGTTPAVTGTTTPAAPVSLSELIDDLEDEGADVQRRGSIEQPFLPVTGQRLLVDNVEVQVFEFEDEATRETFSDQISENSAFLGMANSQLTGNVNVWAQGRLLALYVGEDADVIGLMSDLLGEPILEP